MKMPEPEIVVTPYQMEKFVEAIKSTKIERIKKALKKRAIKKAKALKKEQKKRDRRKKKARQQRKK